MGELLQYYYETREDKTLLKIIASIKLMERGYTVFIPPEKIEYDLVVQKNTELIPIKVEHLNSICIRSLPLIRGNPELIFAIDVTGGFFALIPAKKVLLKRQIKLTEKNVNLKYLNSFAALEEY